MSQNIYSVSKIVRYIKDKLEKDPVIQRVNVEGEISNFSNYRSGHWYFSLKDDNSIIRCVMFAGDNSQLDFMPKDGDKVVVTCYANVYEQRGELQLICTNMKPSGLGELYVKFEMLKKKLSEEGLFDDNHKQEIPKYPFNIAIITGKNTAAHSDILTTLSRRWPVAKIYDYPVLVQGNESARQIIQALLTADSKKHDVIILSRGGGSIEDLWPFNDEALAYTIYNLKTPIITGVGHETDFTIADFVADVRANTPTGAAELITPNIYDVLNELNYYNTSLNKLINAKYDAYNTQLKRLINSSILKDPLRLTREHILHLQSLSNDLQHINDVKTHQYINSLNNYKHGLLNNIEKYTGRSKIQLNQTAQSLKSIMTKNVFQENNRLTINKQALNNSIKLIDDKYSTKIKQNIKLLDAYSPLKILERGYSVVTKDENVVKTINNIHENDQINIKLSDGSIESVVTKIRKD